MRSIITVATMGLAGLAPLAGQVNYTSQTAVPSHSSRTYENRENMELGDHIFSIATSGTNNVWDLTGVPLSEPYERTVYFEPAEGSAYHSNYPSANLVVWETDPFGNEDHQYFNNSPFELRLLGGVHVNGEPEFITFCPDPFLVMDYPMGIGSGVQHVYNCEGAQNETDHWVIMATGSAVVEGGTIDDVVLWRSIFSGPGFADTSYFWTETDNVLFPVIRYHPGVSLRIRRPLYETIIGVEENSRQANAFTLFPNPAADRITIRWSGEAHMPVHALVLDAAGRTAADLGRLGNAVEQVDLGGLAPGSYYLELRPADGGMACRRPFIKA